VKIILIFLILLLPKLLMGETKSLLCTLEGTGIFGQESDRHLSTVKINQIVEFNENMLISVKNFHSKEYDLYGFDEEIILREGVKIGVLMVNENIVSDEYIKMTIVQRAGEKIKLNGLEVTSIYQSVQINRKTGTSKTSWFSTYSWPDGARNIQDYNARGDCTLIPNKKF
jgi:hypothetical protein